MKALTLPEIESLLSRASPQLHAMVQTQFNHAMRSSEVTGLLRSDVDLQARTILVKRLKASRTTLQPLRDDEFKSLSEWLAIAPQSRYVFPSTSGRRMDRSTYYRWFRHVAELADIPKEKRHPHCVKHGVCMHLLKRGLGLVQLQTYVGHASIQSTMHYLELSQEEASAEAMKAFDKCV